MFSRRTILMYYFKLIFMYAPLNIIMTLFAMYVWPHIGTGPIWNNYVNLMKPCNQYWWTTFLYINNLYPNNFDDKCMAWSWFLPVYI